MHTLWLYYLAIFFWACPGASWLLSCTKTYLRTHHMRPAAIVLNYSVNNIQNNVPLGQAWASSTLACWNPWGEKSLCNYDYSVHVNYSATTWNFGANCFSITEVLYSSVHLMKHVQSDVMNLADTWWKTSYRALQYFQNCNIMCRLLLLLFMWYSTARSGSPQDALHLH